MGVFRLFSRIFARRQGLSSRVAAGVRIPAFVRVSSHQDGLALLNVRRGEVFLCNRTGSRIWQGLSEGRSPEDVAAEIGRQYGLAPETARAHTFAFVGELERRGLVGGAT